MLWEGLVHHIVLDANCDGCDEDFQVEDYDSESIAQAVLAHADTLCPECAANAQA